MVPSTSIKHSMTMFTRRPPFEPMAIHQPLGLSHRSPGVDIDHFENTETRMYKSENILTPGYCLLVIQTALKISLSFSF